jgi:regulatory protein
VRPATAGGRGASRAGGSAEQAIGTAFRLLARRDFFADELRERLRQQGFDEDEVEAALGRCAELAMVDDRRTAMRFVQSRVRSRGWGPARLRAEMERRGASREVAVAAVRELEREPEEALRRALERLERRAGDGWWRLPARRARMVNSLIGRGFDAGHARAAVTARAAERGIDLDASDDEP